MIFLKQEPNSAVIYLLKDSNGKPEQYVTFLQSEQ